MLFFSYLWLETQKQNIAASIPHDKVDKWYVSTFAVDENYMKREHDILYGKDHLLHVSVGAWAEPKISFSGLKIIKYILEGRDRFQFLKK